jgi:hypothetical protein
MKRTTLLLAIGAGALALLLSSCTNGTEDTTTSTVVPTTTPMSAVLVSATKDSSNCVDCHTDQESLQAMAVEPVEESLNEGEG